MSKPFPDVENPVPCGTCGADLNEPGQWLRCRQHYVAEIKRLIARVAELENDGRNDKRLRGVVEHLRDISGFDPFRRDAFISAIRSARKALKGAGQWSGDIEDSTTEAAQTAQDLILRGSEQLEAKTEQLAAWEALGLKFCGGITSAEDMNDNFPGDSAWSDRAWALYQKALATTNI